MQQIAEWFEGLGMSEYAERFADNRIDDVSILRDLTDQDLKDMWSLGLDAGSKVVSDARLP
jgi:hypothetical protein